MHVYFTGPINGITYLVLVNSHTKWPEIIPMASTSASAAISVLDKIFITHGLPETTVLDNETRFTSAQFKEYCKNHAVSPVQSPLYHPQSNGQAEKFVDTSKRALRKTKEEERTEWLIRRFLTTYRTSVHSRLNGKSLAEVLIWRTVRTINHATLIRSASCKPEKLLKRVTFKVGDSVLTRNFRPGQTWTTDTLARQRGSVLYEIQVKSEIWLQHRN